MRHARLLALMLLLLVSRTPAFAQTPIQQVDPQNTQGLMPYFPYGGAREDINFESGGLRHEIPLVSLPGRNGHNFDLSMHYDSKTWRLSGQVVPFTGTVRYWCVGQPICNGNGNYGWVLSLPSIFSKPSVPMNVNQTCTADYAVDLGDGAWHAFGNQSNCTSNSYTIPVTDSDDAAFLRLDTTNTADIVLHKKDGTQIHFTSTGINIQDTDGNIINITTNTNGGVIKDTLGRSITYSNDPSTHVLTSVGYIDSNGISQSITFSYTNQTFSPTFQQPTGVTNPRSWTQQILTSINLPTGRSFGLSYNNYGEITQIAYPAGGYTRYDFAVFTVNWFINTVGSYAGDFRELTARHVCTSSSGACSPSQEETTTYTPTVDGTKWNNLYMDVRDPTPAHNRTRHQFPTAPGSGTSTLVYAARELSRTIYQGESTALQTATTDYDGLDAQGITEAWSLPIRTTTTLNDTGQVSKVESDYDTRTMLIQHYTGYLSAISTVRSIDNVTEEREFSYGSGTSGPLLRKTDNVWLKTNPINNIDYTSTSINILNRKASEQIFDPAISPTTPIAQTQFEYDNYTAGLSASGAVQHNATFGTSYLTRANLTATKHWRNTDGAWLVTRNQFDDAGNVLSTTDPLSHTTSFSYADSWGNTACVPTGGNAAAYRTATTNALSQTAHANYNSCPGTPASATDPNSLTTTHSYDLMLRHTQSNFPDTGQGTACFSEVSGSTCYSASLPLTITQTQKINPTLTKTSKTILDGLGRSIQTQLTSDPQSTVFADTTYDALGQVATVSNPYRQGNDPTSSPGTTTYGYDALGRKTSETYPDGSVLTTAYCGPNTLVTDPTGRWRRSRADALGRLVEVDEPNAPSASVNSNGCPGAGEPIWVTTYGYDILGNLTSVLQNGSHSRSFTFDSLSHLLIATNPETGQITYAYNDDGVLISKTDARGITTSYSPSDSPLDALHRVTKITYSNGDPPITFAYDQANCLGLSSCQNVGHRTSMTDAAGSESWAYQVDTANSRTVHNEQRTTSGISKTSAYFVDLAGNVYQINYPTGRTVNYTFDAANRPKTAADGSNGITYATDFQTVPSGCLSGAVCYTPQGTFYALSIGQATGFTGLDLFHTYNNRLQPNEFKGSSSGGNAIDISYNFVDPSTSKNAGHVYGITNNLDSTRSQTFSYDQLNRITGALTTSTHSTSPSHCWGETYTLDAWANLNSIAQTTNSAYTGCSQESGFSTTADGNNHLPIFGYDLSGNTSSDGVVTNYQWDAESQLKSAAGITYTYDGDGRRVSKVGSKLYWYGSGGDILAETDASGNTQNEYIFFGGKRIAVVPLGGKPMYYVEDMLGTSRVLTSGSATRIQSSGGTNVWKYYYTGLCPGVSGTTYTISVLIKNQGTASMQIGGNIAYGPVIAPGTTQQVSFTEVGNGVSCIQFGLLTLNTGDPMDVLAYAPVISVGGTNLIPTSNQDFSGWSAYQGASVIITQGQPPQVVYDADFYPYGGERAYVSVFPQNYKFEGKERDTETGNDDFGARYYSNRFGRWLSADWSAVPEAVPYANLTNPQTLNLYSMVSDDPESFADLDGHCCEGTLQWGEELIKSGNPVGEVIGAVVVGGAVIAMALSSPEVREKAVDIASQNAGDAPFVLDKDGKWVVNPILAEQIEDAARANGSLKEQTPRGGAPGSRPGKDFTQAGKKVIDERDGNKCQNCGRNDLKSEQNKKGQPTPQNQRQRHHMKHKKEGGSGTPENGKTLCPECHKKEHQKKTPALPQPPPPPTCPSWPCT